MTLKEIALALLKKYESSETDVIWEYSGDIEKSLDHLGEEVEKWRKKIEEAKE